MYHAIISSTQSEYPTAILFNRRVYVTETISSSSPSATSTSILAKAVATTHLSWWQLLALILSALLVLVVGIWLWWRHRKKVKVEEAKKREEIEERERKRIEKEKEKEKELIERMRGRAKGMGTREKKREESQSDKEMWSDSETETETGSESDDSISDGGTIRPSRTRRWKVRGRRRRRQRRGRDRFGHRRRRSESESMTETDYSDETYYPRRHQWRERDGDRARRRDRYWRKYPYDPYYNRPPPPSHHDHPQPPVPVVPPIPQGKRRKRDTFRDSVFSSYNSMKKAAVRLKYMEAKVKLKKQLEEEEKLEKIRRDKVKEANMEIEKANEEIGRMNGEMRDRKGSSGKAFRLLMIVDRPEMGHSSSGSSSSAFPPKNNTYSQTTYRGGSFDTTQRKKRNTRQIYPAKNATMDTIRSRAQPGRTETDSSENSLGDEITHLLGGGSKGRFSSKTINPASRPPPPAQKVSVSKRSSNAFQASWLSHPSQPGNLGNDNPSDIPSMLEAARTGSVYLPVTHPKDRPIISKGGLAPAPTRKKKGPSTKVDSEMGNTTMMSASGSTRMRTPEKSSPGFAGVSAGANVAGVGAGGLKWAGRLRERMKIDS